MYYKEKRTVSVTKPLARQSGGTVERRKQHRAPVVWDTVGPVVTGVLGDY